MAQSDAPARELDALLDGWTQPRDLLVGAASSGYQCEGGFNGRGQPQNNFAEWERRPGNEPSGAGTRFWDRRWKDDLDLARAMGLNAFRLSIEWARLYPSEAPERHAPPPLDAAALDRYAEIISGAEARGLEPVVTLCHFTHPRWAGVDLWLREDAGELYLAYVDEVVPALNRRLLARGARTVRWWVTFNEPNVLLLTTYAVPFYPTEAPRGAGLVALANLLRATDRLYAAHVRAYAALHRIYRDAGWPAPKVGLNHVVVDAYGLDRASLDVLCARARGLDEAGALEAEMRRRASRSDEMLAGMRRAGRRGLGRALAGMLRPLTREAVGPRKLPGLWRALRDSPHERPLDYLGFDLYDPLLQDHVWPPTQSGPMKTWSWRHYPESLYDAAFLYAEVAPALPVFVLENGMAVERADGSPARPRADGWTRDRFIRAHLFHFLRALKDGAPLLGYLHWSISDNYEWGSYRSRFGLHAVDLADPERPRLPLDAAGVDAAGAYRAVAEGLRAGDAQRLFDSLAGPRPHPERARSDAA